MDLSDNQLCGLDSYGRGTYSSEGIKAIADALRVSASLTECDLVYNQIGDEGAKFIAEALRSNGSLTVCSLLKNDLSMQAASSLARLGKEKNISLSGVTRDQTEANYYQRFLRPVDAVLIAADLAQ